MGCLWFHSLKIDFTPWEAIAPHPAIFPNPRAAGSVTGPVGCPLPSQEGVSSTSSVHNCCCSSGFSWSAPPWRRNSASKVPDLPFPSGERQGTGGPESRYPPGSILEYRRRVSSRVVDDPPFGPQPQGEMAGHEGKDVPFRFEGSVQHPAQLRKPEKAEEPVPLPRHGPARLVHGSHPPVSQEPRRPGAHGPGEGEIPVDRHLPPRNDAEEGVVARGEDSA